MTKKEEDKQIAKNKKAFTSYFVRQFVLMFGSMIAFRFGYKLAINNGMGESTATYVIAFGLAFMWIYLSLYAIHLWEEPDQDDSDQNNDKSDNDD